MSSTIFKNDFFHITQEPRDIYNIRYHRKLDFMVPYSLYKEERIDGKNLIEDKYFDLKISNIPIMTLKDYLNVKEGQLSYNDINNLLVQVGNQILTIERNNMTVPFIDPNDIIVINNYFIYLGVNIIPIEEDNDIMIVKPYKKSIFFSPELLSITTLPNNVSRKSWIYSLGILCIFCLSKDKRLMGKNKDDLMEKIKDIESTKVYFCIERCINPDTNNRYYYYI